MTFSVAVWNMDSWRRKGNPRGWAALEELGADVLLLNEATRPSIRMRGLRIEGRQRTRGRDYSRPWASLIASPHPMSVVDARVKRVPFQTGRPGTWTASVISMPRANGRIERVTAVSLYGLLDEMSDASVHRSLSELAAIFDDRRYSKLVLLGGDLNTWTGWNPDTDPRHLARDKSVLQRIEAYGLVDCLKARRRRGRLEKCPCRDRTCKHTQTRRDHSGIPYQMDYLFASQALADRLERCVALAADEWFSLSDHCPIIARFRN
jgi:endonuclease/exonuclease/phosphatase family metal-dependent hydrolase